MKQKCLNRFIALALIIVLTTSSMVVSAKSTDDKSTSTQTSSDDAAEDSKATTTNTTYSNEMINNNYTIVSSKYTLPKYEGDIVEIPVNTSYDKLSGGKIASDNYGYKNEAVDLTIGDKATFVIEAPEDAQYYVSFDYLAYSESMLPVELSMTLNGETPFYEARRLVYESTWVDESEASYDRYGNQIVSIPDKAIQWENKFIKDASYRNTSPLAVELKKGRNEITLEVSEGSILIGNFYLNPEKVIPEYEVTKATEGKEIITIEAEDFDTRNSSSIRATSIYDDDLSPYASKEKKLNVIDSASFADAGQKIGYNFKVEKEGYYYIAFNYKQNKKSDFPVFTNIYIDGEIPNTNLVSYPFDYEKKFTKTTLKDTETNDKIAVYLTKGTHSIEVEIANDNIKHVLEAVDRIMNEINDLALEITKVAGSNKDKNRDFDMEKYIPDAQERLNAWADELDELEKSVKKYNTDVKSIAAFSSISVASNRLRSLAKKPDKLPYRINELSQSTNSVNQYLANLIDTLNANDIAFDRIFIYQEDAKLPKKAGVFTKLGKSISRFFTSFSDQAYSTSNTNKEHIQVWVNRSRQYIEIMQKMIDETFTPATGISVDLSIMPDQNKLILANSSGKAPDIATGINYAIPFELGIRGAIKDLTEFDDFTEVASRYSEGLLVPSTIGDGIYSLPETMNFWVLFYRTDILGKLGLEVPNTIEDVKDMLPELQMRGLNFYYPTAGMTMKNFHGTTPLLFQYGATLYGEDAGNTAINSEQAIKGFTELTDLFTIYNLPKDIPNFYQHFRNGDLPIGIGDYGVYNMLTNAAPEIANSWDIALVPGVEGDDGEVKRYTSGGAESTVMFKTNDEREAQAWEFMKWWSSADVQAEFGQTLQITYGKDFIWNTANTEAFAELPWNTKDKAVIIDQSKWVVEAPRILGTYMLEREISNAYNLVVVSGENLRTTIDAAVKTVNRETKRKLEEFGFIDEDGNTIKEYKVPTIEKVREILEKNK
jgi:ABC-type glycerol-3-phosphate transport system substrate-binding protein